eukprot:COSAG06_NODE_2654_length_6488_cov_4.182658_2_plen_99_part_00
MATSANTVETALPTFAVSSGDCTVTEGGACFRSPNYPDSYGASGDCAIAFAGSGFVKSTAFATESGYDYVAIGGTRYSGDGGALSSSGVEPEHLCKCE